MQVNAQRYYIANITSRRLLTYCKQTPRGTRVNLFFWVNVSFRILTTNKIKMNAYIRDISIDHVYA